MAQAVLPVLEIPGAGLSGYRVTMDLTGPWASSYTEWPPWSVLVTRVVEYLSTFLVVFTIKSKIADEISRRLMICPHRDVLGHPRDILSDQGLECINSVVPMMLRRCAAARSQVEAMLRQRPRVTVTPSY